MSDPANPNENPAPTELAAEVLQSYTVPVNVDGEVKQQSLADIVSAAQKATAADKRFQEASQLRKSAEEAVQIREDMEAGLHKHDEVALRRAFRNLGMTDDQINAILTPSGTPDSATSPSHPGTPSEDPEDDMTTELNGRIAELEQQLSGITGNMQKARETAKMRKYQSEVDTVVDSDEELSIMLRELDSEGQQFLRAQVYQSVGRRADVMPWGTNAIQSGISELKGRSWFKKLQSGVEGNPPEDDLVPGEFAGLGPSGIPASQTQLHPPGREAVPVFDKDYSGNVLSRLAQKVRKAGSRPKG